MRSVSKQLPVEQRVRTSACKYDKNPYLDSFPAVGGGLLVPGHLPFLGIACPAFTLATIIQIHRGKHSGAQYSGVGEKNADELKGRPQMN